MKPLLVGEMNPYGMDPDMALYPLPEYASGGRLAKILGLTRGQYLRAFDRVNLCVGKWDLVAAVATARLLLVDSRSFVLLGAKVAKAFGLPNAPFTRSAHLYLLPHPSGLCRAWGEPNAAQKARELVLPLIAPEDVTNFLTHRRAST